MRLEKWGRGVLALALLALKTVCWDPFSVPIIDRTLSSPRPALSLSNH